MGQYYKPMILSVEPNGKARPASWIYSHEIKSRYKGWDGKMHTMGQGLKLMEHSWIGNKLCQLVEFLLLPGNAWHKKPMVWAGDYADDEPDTCYNWMDKDGNIHEAGRPLYSFCSDETKFSPVKFHLGKKFHFILNHTTKQFVDKRKVPKGTGDWKGWQVHPLPLLTCDGNGRGGGDYRLENNQIGIWARHIISVDDTVPADYTELQVTFTPC